MTAAGDAAIDSDTADPTVPGVSNNAPNTPQLIRNPVTLGGYANLATDEFDVFQVELAGGQIINLFIAEDGAANDLDLTLADSNLNIVDQSLDTGKFESLTVPGSGTATYIIQVNAFAGASNYVLTITQPGAGGSAPATISAMSTQAEFMPDQVLVQYRAEDGTAPQARAKSMGGDWLAGVPGGVDLLDISTRAKSQTSAGLNGLRSADPGLAARIATLTTIKAIARQPGVDYAEPNLIRRASAVPDDEFFNQQWHYNLINLPQAWDITTGSPDVIVAVADTGVRLNHPDLIGKFDPLDPDGFDFVSDPSRSLDGNGIDGNADDPGDGGLAGNSSFHGTHVAGTIGAATDNGGFGAAAVGWDTRIMPLRVLGANGSGSSFDIQNAVLYAAGLNNATGQLPPRPADLINLSLGADTASQSEQAAYAAAVNAGLIVIAAAGNSGDSRQSFPASYPGVVSVAAVGRQKQRAPYSQFNATVDVAAPGGDQSRANPDGVLSTLSSDSSLPIRDGVGFLQGTSMAAPHMAGVVALMKAVNPRLTPAQLDQLLAGSITEDLGTPGRDSSFGHGLIDANLAVREAIRLANGQAPADNPRLSAQPDSLNFGNTLTTATMDVTNAGTGALAVTSVSDDAPWLSVSAQAIDDDGLGRYQVVVDRSGLTDGTLAATLTFTSAINTVSVPVLISVGQVSGRIDAGKQYVLLIDPATSAALAQDEVSIGNDGTYAFSFQNVAPGNYQLISGTDSDNDGFICDDGEACGAFPALDSPLIVEIDDASRTNLDFLVSFGLSTPTVQGGVRPPRAGYRLLD